MAEAEHALWREAGLNIFPPDGGIHWPRVAASCDFHGALYFEQEFEVRIRVAALTKRAIRYTCDFTSHGRKIATGTITAACVRMRMNGPLKSVDIPPEIAGRFEVAHDLVR